MRRVGRCAVVLLTTALLVGCRSGSATDAAPTGNRGAAGSATVARIVDGDTLVARIAGVDEHVRLIGIDTPETKKPDTPVECFGPEASARLNELLPGGTELRLERDAEARDKYGRLLAYVYRDSDGLFINLTMAADGFASSLTIKPNDTHAHEIDAAVGEARRARRGLWGVCSNGHQPQSGPP
jgi:micrococcal nuclease